MIETLLAAALVMVALTANRFRIRKRVEREYHGRFNFDGKGIARGAEPFTLTGTNGCGVLLIHGSGDSPQTMRYLGQRLNEAGYTVHAVLLPGHGRSPRAFAEATAEDYVSASREALGRLEDSNTRVALVGLSMGGAIATQLAAEDPAVRALVLLAPYLVPPPLVRRTSVAAPAWGVVSPYLAGGGEASVLDAKASRDSRAYGTFSPGALRALVATASAGLAAVKKLRLPVMVVNSEGDNRIPRASAEEALGAFEPQPETHWVSGCAHVITIDFCKDEVARLTIEFLGRTTGEGGSLAAGPA